MTNPIEKACEQFKQNYDRALHNPTVKNPLAWALYKTWRMAEKGILK